MLAYGMPCCRDTASACQPEVIAELISNSTVPPNRCYSGLALSKLFSKARKCHWYLERVAALMGHTSLETTRIYTTPTEQDLTKAVEKLAD
jgi:hypothetical protein